MAIVIGVLSILLVLAIFVIWNLLRKFEKAEGIIIYNEDYIRKFSEVITFCNVKIKQIDERGTFKSDDEIGFFFNEIKKIQDLLNQFNAKKI